MGKTPWGFIPAVLVVALLLGGPVSVEAAGEAVATAADRTSLRLTIYDRGSALVEETRRVRLRAGGSLTWRDVPKTLDPTSVQLAGPPSLKVLEERFRYDPTTHERLLKAARGGRVTLVERVGEAGEERRTEAVLLAAEGPPVFRIGQEVHLGHPGRVVLPHLPDGLALEPELVWRTEGLAGEAALTARYLAGGLQWGADYVLVINEATLAGALSGAFSITNTSGADVDGARVQLVAGVVRRVEAKRGPIVLRSMAMAESAREAPVADLHRYTVKAPVSVADGRTVRIGFLQADGVKLARRYEVRGGGPVVARRTSGEERLPVAVVWTFPNTTEAGLGRPLPAGTVRVYVAQGDRPLLLAGEVPLSHTPAGVEEVELETSEAFDLVATRRQTAFQRLGKNVTESAWGVTVENKKEVEVAVRLIERVPAQAELVEASHTSERPSADRLVFAVTVPPGRAVEVTYRVRVRR